MKTLSEALGIEYQPSSIDYEEDESIQVNNYRPYGGGGWGHLNGFYGKKHTDESKIIMSELKQNYVPWNVGVKGYSVHTEKSKKAMSDKLSGSQNGRALLTEETVREIIELYLKQPSLNGVGKVQGNGKIMSYEWAFCLMISSKYGVTAAAVKRLVRKQSWKNVWSEYKS